MKRIALVYGYGQLANGELDAQTIGRCRKALELFKKKKVDEIFITVGVRRHVHVMAEKMKQWLMSHGPITSMEITISPRALNTAGETEICNTMLGIRADRCAVTAVSSWYHLPRIWLLWLMRGRLVRLAGSTEGIHRKDLWIEPVKMVNSTLRPFSSAKLIP